jgi:outer membrane protein assembly factor BamB
VALDRESPTELWALNANAVSGIWNNDWDGNPSIVDDILYEGGENSWFFAVKLNRAYDARGLVTVDPERLVSIPGWTDQLLADIGDRNVSIENSVALFEDRVYFSNSGGRVVGLDIGEVARGEAPIVFDFWAGDDVDASIVVDRDGMIYVSVELERFLPRAEELGQIIKLDPYNQDDPVLWSVEAPPRRSGEDGGLWATPALYGDYLYAPTHAGDLLVVDRHDGRVVSREPVGWHAWSSPVVVDETLVVSADCVNGGELRGYDLDDPARPALQWTAPLPSGACIESTPALWKGRIVVGARDGFFYAFGDE